MLGAILPKTPFECCIYRFRMAMPNVASGGVDERESCMNIANACLGMAEWL
jgi:hypothetical protein